LINTFYVKIYKNSTLINTYTYNINGNYSNTVNAYSTIDVKSWINNSSILVDEAICNDYTSYEIKVSYDVAVTYTGVGTFNHCSMVFNDTDSKFIKYESVPSSITGITTTDLLTTNLLLAKGGIASIQGFSNTQTIPSQYINFYYNSSIKALEIWLLSGNPTDIGGGVNNSFTSQRIGYINYSVSIGSSTGVNIYSQIPNNLDISGLTDDVITYNYLECNYDMTIYGNLFVNGYIYSTVQKCFIADLNNTYLQSNEINTITISSIYSNLYSITSDNITVNNLNSNLFYSTRGQIDILTNSTIARMSDVYSNNLYNSSIIVCDNDIYSNNLRCNSFLSLSDSIILNQNLTLQYPFVTPNNINMLGYQIIGTIINNNTNITSNTLYIASVINLSAGVWNILGEISFKCTSITGSNPLITYEGFSLNNITTTFGTYRKENCSSQSVAVNKIYSDQIFRVTTHTSSINIRLLHKIVFQDCTLALQSSTSVLSGTRIA